MTDAWQIRSWMGKMHNHLAHWKSQIVSQEPKDYVIRLLWCWLKCLVTTTTTHNNPWQDTCSVGNALAFWNLRETAACNGKAVSCLSEEKNDAMPDYTKTLATYHFVKMNTENLVLLPKNDPIHFHYVKRTLEENNMQVIKWWVDASLGAHPNMHGHTWDMQTLAQGAKHAIFARQNVNP